MLLKTWQFVAYDESCKCGIASYGHFLRLFCNLLSRGEATRAAESLRTALREYDLKFSTILNDPDLASFRSSSEFKELQEEVMPNAALSF